MNAPQNPFELGPEHQSLIHVELEATRNAVDELSSIPPPVRSEFEQESSAFQRLFSRITRRLSIYEKPTFEEALVEWDDAMHDCVGSVAGIATLLGDSETREKAGILAADIDLDPAVHGFEWLLALELKEPNDEHANGSVKRSLIAGFNQLPRQYQRSAYYMLEALYGEELDGTAVREIHPPASARTPTATMSQRELHEHASFQLAQLDSEPASELSQRNLFAMIVSAANTLAELERRGSDVKRDLYNLDSLVSTVAELAGKSKSRHSYDRLGLKEARQLGALHKILEGISPELVASSGLSDKKIRYSWKDWEDYEKTIGEIPRTELQQQALRPYAPNLRPNWPTMTDEQRCDYFIGLGIDGDVEKMTTYVSDLPLNFRLHGLFMLLAARQLQADLPLPQTELNIDLDLMTTQSKIANYLSHIFDESPNSRLSQPALQDLREYLELGPVVNDADLKDVARKIITTTADQPDEMLRLLEQATS